MTVTCAIFLGNGEEFKRLFTQFDSDGDGKVSPTELRQLMRTIGEDLSSMDAEAIIQLADSDGDGLLDTDELMSLVGVGDVKEEINMDKHLREAFKLYEMDGRDCITARSLKRMLSRLGASRAIEDCGAMIYRFDLNKDGVLSFDEFRAMMMR